MGTHFEGFVHFDDGRKWLRINKIVNGEFAACWDQCLSEWQLILDTTDGTAYYRHKLNHKVVHESRTYA